MRSEFREMRITFVLPPANMSGGIRVIGIYAEKLSEMGHEVRIVSVQPRRPSMVERVKRFLKGKPPIVFEPNPPSFLDHMKVHHRIAPHDGPVTDRDLPDADVVVATWWETAPWVSALSPSKGAKAYFMQDYGAPGQELWQIEPTWRLPLHIVTIANWLAVLVKEHTPDARVSVVANSVDQEVFAAPPRGKQSRPTVGFLYREMASKGIGIALEAIRLARHEVPDLRVLAFGPAPSKEAARDLTGIEYAAKPDDAQVVAIYTSCDAWIFPSLREGFGLPLLEAMACRTPVIATPAGAAPELVRPDRGFPLPDFEPASMAREIVRLAQMEDAAWRMLSDAARQSVEGYTWQDATRSFEKALEVTIAHDQERTTVRSY